MNDTLAQQIREESFKFFSQEPKIDVEEESLDHITSQQDYDELKELCFFVTILNTKSALQTIVGLRNKIHNSKTLTIYEFIEEQFGDQLADSEEYITVDFYIGLKQQ